ncbi:hypothetical protein NPIL_383021 [Nephila pilipes]|uniref:Uncharacterized protein n=1 Tax=Nephila pilipes TaxID=299642 RepID=A0A8X6UIA5_NEPPI|nr:hypothetical protein NPIL_383021 [Nephila pilipes]
MSWAFSRGKTPVKPIYLESAVIACFFSSLERLALKQNCYLCLLFDWKWNGRALCGRLIYRHSWRQNLLSGAFYCVSAKFLFHSQRDIKVGVHRPCGPHLLDLLKYKLFNAG